MDAIGVIRGAFVLAAAATTLASLSSPIIKSRLISYGARAQTPSTTIKQQTASKSKSDYGNLAPYVDHVARLQVPHSWFAQFYALSILLCLLWGYEILREGPLFELVAQWTRRLGLHEAVLWHRVALAWCMMLVQGIRRLYECLFILRPSSSQMWFVHWLAGLGFYAGMSVAVWIEGMPNLSTLHRSELLRTCIVEVESNPPLGILFALALFTAASVKQHSIHKHLASLPKYSLPTHPLFNYVVCPHYTAEILIYVSLAMVAAPQNSRVNWTIFSALIFVAVNLGITADVTRTWWETKWGADAVKGRERIVPWIW